jgi:hypothetical protein
MTKILNQILNDLFSTSPTSAWAVVSFALQDSQVFHYVAQTGLELCDPPASTSQVLGQQDCTTVLHNPTLSATF